MSNKNISIGLTAFLDILGFGERVLNSRKISDIDAIARDIRKIQAEFDYKPKDALTREGHENYKKSVLAFSDSVIVNIPFQSDMTELEGTFDPLMSELHAMALAQGRCVTTGLFLRGGVDLGWWYRRGATLVSQSMVRAYKTEGLVNVPVIALTDELYKYFSKHSHRNYYSEDNDPVHALLRQYSVQGEAGEVTFWYLDYIKIYAESIDWITSRAQHQSYIYAAPDEKQAIMDDGYKTNLTNWFSLHARVIEEAYEQAKNERVKNKYAWLAAYHNDVAVEFTAMPICLCKVNAANPVDNG